MAMMCSHVRDGAVEERDMLSAAQTLRLTEIALFGLTDNLMRL